MAPEVYIVAAGTFSPGCIDYSGCNKHLASYRAQLEEFEKDSKWLCLIVGWGQRGNLAEKIWRLILICGAVGRWHTARERVTSGDSRRAWKINLEDSNASSDRTVCLHLLGGCEGWTADLPFLRCSLLKVVASPWAVCVCVGVHACVRGWWDTSMSGVAWLRWGQLPGQSQSFICEWLRLTLICLIITPIHHLHCHNLWDNQSSGAEKCRTVRVRRATGEEDLLSLPHPADLSIHSCYLQDTPPLKLLALASMAANSGGRQ